MRTFCCCLWTLILRKAGVFAWPNISYLLKRRGTKQEIDSCNLYIPSIYLQAANYLDIKGLLDVTCKTVANMIKGKTPEEIRKTFNIKNDFSASEEEQVRKENEWCEEK